MAIPDLPTPSETSAMTRSGLAYHLLGTVQQTLIVDLKPGQSVFTDAGAMSWMSASVSMNATTGGGGLTGMFTRMISGATAFLIDFAAGGEPGQVAFSTDFPGKVLALDLDPGQSIILHKHAFLCAEKSASLNVFWNKRLGAGFFGGEGFVLQKLTGPGAVFAEMDGDAVEYHLKAGETLKVEPGHVAMFEESVSFDVATVAGIANILFAGEGVFLATLTGPGRIWLHSMTESKVAHRLAPLLPGRRST